MTSVSARWRVPYAVEENLRGMTERKKERMKDRVSGFLLLDAIVIYAIFMTKSTRDSHPYDSSTFFIV